MEGREMVVRMYGERRYDTATATLVAFVGKLDEASRLDQTYHDTNLYRTPSGNWFLSGDGGFLSMWAEWVGPDVIAIDPDEARTLLEQHHCTKELEHYFGKTIKDR